MKLRSLNQNDRLKILNGLKVKNLIQLYKMPNNQRDNSMLVLNFVFLEFNRLFAFLKKDHSVNFDKESLFVELKE